MGWRAIILIGAMLATGGGADDAAKKELKKLHGSWKIVRSEVDGIRVPAPALAKVTAKFDGGKLTFDDAGKVYDEIECKLDPAESPKRIDYRYVGGIKKGVTEKGIYELDGDTLKVCISLARNKRPDVFDAVKGSARQFIVLKRVTP